MSIIENIAEELERAQRKHGPMNSPHEAYAVIKEELDEFWDEVKKQKPDKAKMHAGLVQIGAMAARACGDLDLGDIV